MTPTRGSRRWLYRHKTCRTSKPSPLEEAPTEGDSVPLLHHFAKALKLTSDLVADLNNDQAWRLLLMLPVCTLRRVRRKGGRMTESALNGAIEDLTAWSKGNFMVLWRQMRPGVPRSRQKWRRPEIKKSEGNRTGKRGPHIAGDLSFELTTSGRTLG